MPTDKNPDQLVADSMTSLFGSLGVAFRNPLAAAIAKPMRITRSYRIEGRVLWEDTNEPVTGLTLGLGGVETKTDNGGRFTLVVEKKLGSSVGKMATK
jgi:hypothetical protein